MKRTKLLIILCVFLATFLVGGISLALEAPTLTVSTAGTTLSLSWTSVAGATGYTLSYAPAPYTGPDTIGSIPMGTQTSWSATLWEGAAYFVAVQAYDSVGSSVYSNIEYFAIDSSLLNQQLQNILDTAVVETGATGAVLSVKSPSFQWTGSSGFSNRETKTAMVPTDMLRLASMTKSFVSVVVQKLSEEGKFDLDDKIQQYLPAVIVDRISHGSEVTIRQLLNMTSGIYSYTEIDNYNDEVERNPYRSPWTPEEILEYVYPKKAVFSPGEGWEYSNTNYILFDMLVKEVSGTSLASEMRRIIHNPLGLSNTFMEIQEPRDGGFGGLIVRGYEKDGEDVTEIQDALGLGDGGLISDAEGVVKFLQGLFVDKVLLSATSLNQMRIFNSIEDYGLGLERRKTKFGEAWGHSGGSSGFEGDMLYFPESEVIFVFLTNTMDTNVCEKVFQRSMELLLFTN